MITETAEKILKERYYLPGETSWNDVAKRVSLHFGKSEGEQQLFYEMLTTMDALPNSPALMNAGTDINSFAACFVLPVEDNIESIYDYYKNAALISKSGGGVGANFSPIRKRGSDVGSTGKVASGPLSFMEVQNVSTETIKQGGKRRGANMGVLDVDHPDIMEFIKAKDTPGVLENFNLSVRVTDKFMKDVTRPGMRNNRLRYDKIWDAIIDRAWSSAEPGILFGDAAEKGNLVPHLGKLTSTNPCGEQWLLPYEACTLGSINLSNMARESTIKRGLNLGVDWKKLKETTETMVLMLNRIIDKTEMPIPECQEAMEKTRKIGLGIMGLHDLLIQMDIRYDTQQGRSIAGSVMRFVSETAARYSEYLGDDEGYYGRFGASGTPARRNAHLTSIQPTGTLSMLANCASGCEPYFAPITYKTVLDNTEFEMPNRWLVKNAVEAEVNIKDYLKQHFDLYKGAQDIHWREHVKMQAELQKYVDSSISKTINMPNEATREDIKEAYELAWKSGCKGITVYRDGSRESQVLSTESGSSPEDKGKEGGQVAGTQAGDSAMGVLGEDGGGSFGIDPNNLPVRSEEEQAVDRAKIIRGVVGKIESHGTSVRGVHPHGVGLVDGSEPTTVEDFPVPYKLDLPDKLKSTRYRIKDNDGKKVYFNVCTQAGNPVEVFARLPEPDQDSYWRLIGRLITMSLRYNVPLKDVCKQLSKSSQSVGDVPAKLARILDGYQDSEVINGRMDSGDSEYVVDRFAKGGGGLKCPKCGWQCIPEGGCWQCHGCGWSKCS